jgi:2-dehydro-3-deoxygalactonokinase
LACDWGGTNLRAWVLAEDGAVLRRGQFPLGVTLLAPGEAARRFHAEVRPALSAEQLPAILCGMIGSDLGWIRAPYVDCAADEAAVAAALVAIPGEEPPTWIVPGIRSLALSDAVDVMRGEETQLFGWLSQDESRREGRHVICHPGTHTKWMVVDDGRLLRFVTAMTGELFAVLGRHSVLRSDAPAEDAAAFDDGLAAAGDGGGLAARLFSARARVVGLGRPAETTSSYLSGLLIGAEVAALPALLDLPEDTPITLLGDESLCARYARALGARGLNSPVFDGEAAAIAGLRALYHRKAQS